MRCVFSPMRPGPEEPGSPHALRVQGARCLAGFGVALGERGRELCS